MPPIANEFGLKVTVGAWIDKNVDRNEREIAVGDRSRQAQQQRHRHRGRQRNHLPRRAEDRRPDQADPARQGIGQRSRHHRRNLEHLARPSGARLLGRFHRRAHPALLGRLFRQAGGRSGADHLPEAARRISRQAHRDRRIRLAERRLQSEKRRSRARSSRPWRCAISSAAPKPSAWNTTSSRRSISPGNSSKAASVPIGAS